MANQNEHPAGCDCNEYRKARGLKCFVTLRAEAAKPLTGPTIYEIAERSKTRVFQAGRGKSYLG
jgi:hypothetical protein